MNNYKNNTGKLIFLAILAGVILVGILYLNYLSWENGNNLKGAQSESNKDRALFKNSKLDIAIEYIKTKKISFNLNVNETEINNTKDYAKEIYFPPSTKKGRIDPFLP